MTSTRPRRALIVTFDEFPASILGCFGNEWIETPHLDRLASAAMLGTQCWAAQLGSATVDEAFAATDALIGERGRWLDRTLIFEAESRLDFSEIPFDSQIPVAGEVGPSAKPDRIALAEAVRAARNVDRQASLIWVHGRGIGIPSQPPAGFAELYRDEFEDRGVQFDALSDAQRERHPSMAAGMASLLDHWLGELFAAASDSTLILVTAAQGAPWQTLPNSFGDLDALRSQSAHVPLIVAGETVPVGRNRQLLSTQAVGSILEWWFDEASRRPSFPQLLDRLAANPAGRIMTRHGSLGTRISTPEWSAIFPMSPEAKPLLFRQPEDYWEVNDMADIEPEAIRDLSDRGW
jgi:hypothetical protein